jgi:hypothetical protein
MLHFWVFLQHPSAIEIQTQSKTVLVQFRIKSSAPIMLCVTLLQLTQQVWVMFGTFTPFGELYAARLEVGFHDII